MAALKGRRFFPLRLLLFFCRFFIACASRYRASRFSCGPDGPSF
jgi:hypothetical protein